MRKQPTPAEYKLWQRIRRRQIEGTQFRRQVAIERFIVDFCCIERMLVVEVDGPIHERSREADAVRQEFLETVGFRVLRFTNLEVLNELEEVVRRIAQEVESLPHPNPPQGEGIVGRSEQKE